MIHLAIINLFVKNMHWKILMSDIMMPDLKDKMVNKTYNFVPQFLHL